MLPDCIFCKIVKGELPSEKVYENEKILAFLDINPVNKGHVILVPKEHFDDSLETPDEILIALVLAAKKVAQALKDGLGAEGINFGVNNGRQAGQVIFHTHWHVIPRFANDGLHLWPAREYESEQEKKEIGRKIREKLAAQR